MTRKELLAIVYFMGYYRHYLLGRRVEIRTDHGSLRWLKNLRNPEGQVARWLEKLSAYDWEVEHRPGRLHGNADEWSRKPCDGTCPQCSRIERERSPPRGSSPRKRGEVTRSSAAVMKTVRGRRKERQREDKQQIRELRHLWSQEELELATDRDPVLQILRGWERFPSPDEVSGLSQELKFYWRTRSRWHVDSRGLVWYRWQVDDRRFQWKLVVPAGFQKLVLRAVHDAPAGGHFGEKRSVSSLLRLPVFWFGFKGDMRMHCRTCDDCLRCKPELRKSRAPMSSFTVGEPLQRMAIDIMGPLHRTKRGNCYIAVVMDYFTKWVELMAMPNHTAETVAQHLVPQVFARVGIPLYLHSDQGRDFCSGLFRETCKLFEIERTTTTPWRPQSDGMVERMNRTLGSYLRQYVSAEQDDWDDLLPLCAMA